MAEKTYEFPLQYSRHIYMLLIFPMNFLLQDVMFGTCHRCIDLSTLNAYKCMPLPPNSTQASYTALES